MQTCTCCNSRPGHRSKIAHQGSQRNTDAHRAMIMNNTAAQHSIGMARKANKNSPDTSVGTLPGMVGKNGWHCTKHQEHFAKRVFRTKTRMYSSIRGSWRNSLSNPQLELKFAATRCVTCVLMICGHGCGTLFFAMLVPTWTQLGTRFGPKIVNISIQKSSNSIPTCILLSIAFWIDVWLVFDGH